MKWYLRAWLIRLLKSTVLTEALRETYIVMQPYMGKPGPRFWIAFRYSWYDTLAHRAWDKEHHYQRMNMKWGTISGNIRNSEKWEKSRRKK